MMNRDPSAICRIHASLRPDPATARWILAPGVCGAQLPSGTISGVVRDASGGVIVGVPVQALSRTTGQRRVTMTAPEGDYSFPALPPAEYQVSVEVAGFQRIARSATVEAGTTTRADFALRVGDLNDAVTVPAASAQIHYDSAAVGGVINRDQIQGLPLNGRTFLELAKLEPGVQPPTAANRNRTVVAILALAARNWGCRRKRYRSFKLPP
jgi:hypothetical protein